VDAYTIEVSTRPGIGLVWLGTVLIAVGGLLSMRRRALENRLVPVPDPDSPEKADLPDSSGSERSGTKTALPTPRKPVAVAMQDNN